MTRKDDFMFKIKIQTLVLGCRIENSRQGIEAIISTIDYLYSVTVHVCR